MLKLSKFGQLSRNLLNNCTPKVPLCGWDFRNEHSPMNQFIKRWQYLQQYDQQKGQQQHKRQGKIQQQRETNNYFNYHQGLYELQQERLKQYRKNNLYQQQLREQQQRQQQEQYELEQHLIYDSILKKTSKFRKPKIKFKRISSEFFSMLGSDDDVTRTAPLKETTTNLPYRHLQKENNYENVLAGKSETITDTGKRFIRAGDALGSLRKPHLLNNYNSQEPLAFEMEDEIGKATGIRLTRASDEVEKLKNRNLANNYISEDPLALEKSSPEMAVYLQSVMDQDSIANKVYGIDFAPNADDKEMLERLKDEYGGIDDMRGIKIFENGGHSDFTLIDPFTAAYLLHLLQDGSKFSREQRASVMGLLNSLLELEPDQLMTYLRMLQAQGVLTPQVVQQLLKILKTLGLSPNDYKLKTLLNMLNQISKEEEKRLLREEKEKALALQRLADARKASIMIDTIEPMKYISTTHSKKHKHTKRHSSQLSDFPPLEIGMDWDTANDMIDNVRRMTSPSYDVMEFKKSLNYYSKKLKKKKVIPPPKRNELSFLKSAYGVKPGYTGDSYSTVKRSSSFLNRISKIRKDNELRKPTPRESRSSAAGGRMASFMWTTITSEPQFDFDKD